MLATGILGLALGAEASSTSNQPTIMLPPTQLNSASGCDFTSSLYPQYLTYNGAAVIGASGSTPLGSGVSAINCSNNMYFNPSSGYTHINGGAASTVGFTAVATSTEPYSGVPDPMFQGAALSPYGLTIGTLNSGTIGVNSLGINNVGLNLGGTVFLTQATPAIPASGTTPATPAYAAGLNITNTVFLNTGGLNLNNQAVLNTSGLSLSSAPNLAATTTDPNPANYTTIFLDAANGGASFAGSLSIGPAVPAGSPAPTPSTPLPNPASLTLNGNATYFTPATCHLVAATGTAGNPYGSAGGAQNYVSDARCASNEFAMSGGGVANQWSGANSVCPAGTPASIYSNPGFIHTSVPDADMQGWTIDAYGASESGETCTVAFAICCLK